MRDTFLTIIIGLLFAACSAFAAQAQSTDLPKIEVAAEFTSLTKPDFGGGNTEPGFGGRFTYNISKKVALEAAGYFFPHKCGRCLDANGGNIAEGLFGIKAGKRFQKWGIFAKGRPGVISFSDGNAGYFPTGSGGSFPFQFVAERATHFAFDAGGVIEFYPSRRIVTRFDAGDTLIHYARSQTNVFISGPLGLDFISVTNPAKTRHNFQFMASVGFRF